MADIGHFCVEHDLVTMPEGEHCEVVPSAPFSRAMLAVAAGEPRTGDDQAGVARAERLWQDSARAALMTRGFAELLRVGTTLGAQRETLLGLSGLGDLLLTCSSSQSRNYSLGLREQIIFPEIQADKVEKAHGMTVTIATTAKTDQEGRTLLKLMGMPFGG